MTNNTHTVHIQNKKTKQTELEKIKQKLNKLEQKTERNQKKEIEILPVETQEKQTNQKTKEKIDFLSEKLEKLAENQADIAARIAKITKEQQEKNQEKEEEKEEEEQKQEKEKEEDEKLLENLEIKDKKIIQTIANNPEKQYHTRDILKQVENINRPEKVHSEEPIYYKTYNSLRALHQQGYLKKTEHTNKALYKPTEKALKARKKLNENSPKQEQETNKENKQEQNIITCKICDKEFNKPAGLGGHLSKTHNKNSKNHSQPLATKFSKERTSTSDGSNKEKNTSPATSEELKKRVEKTKQILKNSDKPLTKAKIAQEMYDLETQPSWGDKKYNRIVTALERLKQSPGLEEVGKQANGAIEYTYKEKQQEQKQEQKQKEKEEAGLRDTEDLDEAKRKSGIGEQEMKSLENTLMKTIHLDGKTEISYHDFEKNYGGENRALNAWQKLFQYTPILKELNRRVATGKQMVWNQKSRGGVKSWTLKIKDVETN